MRFSFNTRVVRKVRGHSTYSSKSVQQYEIGLIFVLKNHLAIHIWNFIPKCKILNKVFNIFMQWGVGHGALCPFAWRFRILSHYSLICLKFKHVHEKAFSQSLNLQQHLIKQGFWYFALFFSCREFKLIWKDGSVKRALGACCMRSRYVPSDQE